MGAIMVLCALLLEASQADARSAPLEIAWIRGGQVEYFILKTGRGAAPIREILPLKPGETTPLGSLWKLFVYVYLAGKGGYIPDYSCTGAGSEDVFCCDAAKSIDANEALVKSCGPFFEPSRLSITPSEWASYWRPLAPPSARWLANLHALRPDTQVSIRSLLDALNAIPSRPRQQAQRALTGLVFSARAEGTVARFGGRLRVKTWTWNHPARKHVRMGGFAGWLADGTPIWVRSEGQSGQVIRRHAVILSTWLDSLSLPPEETECVVVRFFTSYALKQVTDLETRHPAKPGVLHGRFRLDFQNGNTLKIRSGGELSLAREKDHLQITGRLGLNEYVARVMDREAAPEPAEAAKAFAVAARTYLVQNGAYLRGCYRIDDSSRTQRVSPNPPGEKALRIAAWTDSLILKDVAVQYHRDQAAPDRLVWTEAVDRAHQKQPFDAILESAFRRGSLASMYGGVHDACERIAKAEDWLKGQSPRWRRLLAAEEGFEPPPGDLAVCRLKQGNPYADFNRKRIYVRGLQTGNDRIALAHEYIHIGFRFHPRGQDEAFVEKTARRLTGD